MAKRVGKWLGGYIRSTKDGKKVYVIERWGQGARFHVSTGCTTERAALKELERFELSPTAYRPGGGETGQQIRFDSELILAYRDVQIAAGITTEWADEVARCLVEWMEAFGARDIRSIDLHRDVRPALSQWSTRIPHRIKALKGFYRWLRADRGLVSRLQDPTLDLRVPQARPAQWKGSKVVPQDDVQAVLLKLPQPTQDILLLMTATAYHLSEVRRFAEGGEILFPVGPGTEGVLGVLVVRHKSGEIVRNKLEFPEHLEAAKRLRERGGIPKRMTLARHMRAAAESAGVPWFGLGQIRHSVLTWAKEQGASLPELAEFAHHKSDQTTRRFYVREAVPKSVPIVRLLKSS